MKTSIELQRIDCNCNDCKFLIRDFEKLKLHRKSFEGTGLIDDLQFGTCSKDNKAISFIPNTCQINTQICFVHRKD